MAHKAINKTNEGISFISNISYTVTVNDIIRQMPSVVVCCYISPMKGLF